MTIVVVRRQRVNQQIISLPTQVHQGTESIISVIKYKQHDITVHKMRLRDLYSSQFTVWLSMHLQSSFMFPVTVLMLIDDTTLLY